jgi:hypothetical protein
MKLNAIESILWLLAIISSLGIVLGLLAFVLGTRP